MKRVNIFRRTFEQIRPRMTPALVVLGAQKSGTTAIFAMLRKHPKALPPVRKELNFFSDDQEYDKGKDYYRSLFPAVPAKSFGHFTFEASPSYLSEAAKTAPRIALDLPNAYCLAILRDPVERAFSAWNMYRKFRDHAKHGHLYEARTFAQAVEDELGGRTVLAAHHYLAHGCYANPIAHFQKELPSDRLIVRSYIEMKQDPDRFVNDICKRLSLAPMPQGTSLKETKAGVLPYTDQLEPALAAELYRYFDPEMKKLDHALGHHLEILENHA